jgi:RNA polymerase sigma factor (sigma-70 family)
VGGIPSSDTVVVARLLAGDDRALTEAYDRYGGMVYGLVRRVTRDDQIAREVTQEVFTFLWELPDRVDLTRGSLRAYLAVIAHRRAVDEVRRVVRRSKAESRASLQVERSPDGHENDVVEAGAQLWERRQLRGVLDELPEEQRVVLSLAYYDGLTYREVAARLGIPEGTAKSRIRLGLARLRGLLETRDELAR